MPVAGCNAVAGPWALLPGPGPGFYTPSGIAAYTPQAEVGSPA
jgi:hypothetical protein